MVLVNLFGGPGIGKSTAAAALYQHFAMRGYRAECVGEAAKDLVWDGSHKLMENQVLLTGLQFQRLKRLNGRVDVAISDSPLVLGYVYARGLSYQEQLGELIYALEKNLKLKAVLDVILTRPSERPYNPEGRIQKTYEEAVAFDEKINQFAVPCVVVPATPEGIETLKVKLGEIFERLGVQKHG